LIFLVIIGEPLLVIWAILRWGVDQRSLDRVLRAGLLMLLFQVPIGLFQGATLGWNDPVQGTLVGHGAGAHVLGGLFALGSLTAAAAVMHGRLRLTAGLALGTVGLGMAFAAGAIQVLIATALGFAALALLGRATPREAGGRVRRSRFSPGMAFAALALAIFGPLLAEAAVPGLFERIQILAQPEQLPEVEMLKTRVDEDLGTFLLGSGPGTTASRASLLLTPQLMKETSPLAFLRIPPTPEALEIASSARVSEAFAGSAEQVASSALGLIGDLGVIGFISAVFLFLRMAHVAKRTGSWLTPAVTGAAVMVLLLIFIDNWIEYPEFAVPLGVVLGLSLSDAAGRPLDEVSVQGFEIRSVSR
jgi:hypothetical protein